MIQIILFNVLLTLLILTLAQSPNHASRKLGCLGMDNTDAEYSGSSGVLRY